MHINSIPFLLCDQLDHKRNNITNKRWHQVDLHRNTGWSRYRRWHIYILSHH